LVFPHHTPHHTHHTHTHPFPFTNYTVNIAENNKVKKEEVFKV